MYNNSDELVIVLNTVESTCAVEFYTVVDTSRSPVYNTSCPLHWVRDSTFFLAKKKMSYFADYIAKKIVKGEFVKGNFQGPLFDRHLLDAT